MIVTAWHDSHGTYGLRIVGAGVGLWFRPEWRWVTVYLPEEDQPLSVSLTESFWRETPVLRSPRLRHFLKRHGLVPWPKKQPPHFELESLGGGVFRLKWLEKVPAQSQLELDG